MAASQEAPAGPAPDGFWDRLQKLHNVLWDAANTDRRVTARLRTLTIHALDNWARADAEPGEPPLLVMVTRWKARQRVGGAVLATLSTGTMRIEDMQAIPTVGDIASSEVPVEHTHAAYTFPRGFSTQSPAVVVRTGLYTPREAAEAGAQQDILAELRQAQRGQVAPPGLDHYKQVLMELAFGASGQFRPKRPPAQ